MTTPTAVHPTPARIHHASPSPRFTVVRLVALMIGPVLVCLGLGLSYLGAFHNPQPHDMKVAVVGSSPKTKVLAQTIKDKAGNGLDVTTVPTRQQAREHLLDRDLVGAYVPTPKHPELLVARAGSSSNANAAQSIFRMVTDKQGVPLKVTDVAPPAPQDPNGGGLFFLLITLSVASYCCVLVLAPLEKVLGMRARAIMGLGACLAVSGVGILLAGPVFDVVDHSYGSVWAMSLLYCVGVFAVGLGLQTFLKQLTPLVLMGLFVMLNLTSAGGLMSPEMQNDFFGALHSFWNGAAFVEGAHSILYFDHHDLGSHLLSLWLWLAAGVLLTLLAARTETRRQGVLGPEPEAVEPDARHEPEAAVPLSHPGAELFEATVAEELAAAEREDR
ncbi:hypothetical protein EV284_1068 [Streptomyces sp. BK022]|uniref:hypothetical protein n=1 Tax=Streptomyces sp. BK022 TaxID=2512123 RepID=UPI0010CEDF00|nr:hypothetical protein [Streptomyces sp. BK022]RZU46393.1 hypothetical protein EV284_1068 [Streptomyces sp. BK022]